MVDFTGATFQEPGVAPTLDQGELWWWGTSYRSMWFRWTAPADATVCITPISGAPSSWEIGVGADAPDWPTFIAEPALVWAWNGSPLSATFTAIAGTTYLIYFVDEGVDNGDGPATAAILQWGPPPPPAAMLSIWQPTGSTHLVGVSTDYNLQTDYAPDQTVEWTVDWGDGSVITHYFDYYYTTVSHTYVMAGTYTVSFTVVNDAGLTTTDTRSITMSPIRGQAFSSGAHLLPTAEGTLHISDWSGIPAFIDTGVTFTGPTTLAQYGYPFDFESLAVIQGGSNVRVLWFSYTAERDATLVIEGTSAPDDRWEPVGVACSDDLYLLNEMYPITYFPVTSAHMGVRVEAGKTYLFGLGLSDFSTGGYLDIKWSYQRRGISGPCMYVQSGDSYAVMVYAVSLTGKTRVVEPALWVTLSDSYAARLAATQDGRLYVPRDRTTRTHASEVGLIKVTNELLHVPPVSVYDKGLFTEGSDLFLDWSEERQQFLIYDDGNVIALKMPDQQITTRGDGWTLYEAFNQLRTGDSIGVMAPAGMSSTSIRVIAMPFWVNNSVGDTVANPVSPILSGDGQPFTPAYSNSISLSGGATGTVTFSSVTYPYTWDHTDVNHYMIIDSSNMVLGFIESADLRGGSHNNPLIYAIDETGTKDYWEVGQAVSPPYPWHTGSFTYTSSVSWPWHGQHIRGQSTFWCAELMVGGTVTLGSNGYYAEPGGGPRVNTVVRYELGDNHVATETLRWTPTLIDQSPESYDIGGFRYFTINKDQTRLLITYDKINPNPEPDNPYHFNSWYTGGMWIQVYDLTAGPTPTFMHEFRFVPWPALTGVYASEPGFSTYQFYAYGVVEFDPTDDNYCFMINNANEPLPGAPSWADQHQTYIFRMPLYADYTVQYAAMRTPWCTFDNSDADENYWFNFGSMGQIPFSVTGPSQSTAKFLPNA